jgi:hypothetical protein
MKLEEMQKQRADQMKKKKWSTKKIFHYLKNIAKACN